VQELKPGVVSVAATVIAGEETDLLAGELDMHEEAHAEEDYPHPWLEGIRPMGRYRWRGPLCSLPLCCAACALSVNRISEVPHETPSVIDRPLSLPVLLSAMPAVAGDGHDHGDAPPAASGSGPKRQPDGSVFLPKPAQRQIGIRTSAG
jgi:hypothetical protein